MINLQSRSILYTIIWISILLSIGTPPSDFLNFGDGFLNSLNSFRIGFPLLASVSLILYYIIIKLKKIKILKNKLILFLLFLLYLIFQIIGLIQRGYNIENLNIDNIYLPLLGSGTIITLFLIDEIKSKTFIKIIMYLSLFIICLSGLTLLFVHLKNSVFESANNFSLYNSVPPNKQLFMNHELPRVTGISRTLAIFNICLFCLYLFFKNNKLRYIFLILNVFFGVIILGFQSRGTVLCYISTISFFLLISKQINLANKIKYFIIIFLIPFVLFETIRHQVLTTLSPELPFEYKSKKPINVLIDTNRLFKDSSSSGRYNLWQEAIYSYDKKKPFGYGPQADRFLLKGNLKKFFSDNVSNAYIYAFLCGGYFGLISFLLFVIGIVKIIIKKIFKENLFNDNKNLSEKISLLFLFFFLIRSSFENSFSLFSIDFIIVIVSISVLTFRQKINQ